MTPLAFFPVLEFFGGRFSLRALRSLPAALEPAAGSLAHMYMHICSRGAYVARAMSTHASACRARRDAASLAVVLMGN